MHRRTRVTDLWAIDHQPDWRVRTAVTRLPEMVKVEQVRTQLRRLIVRRFTRCCHGRGCGEMIDLWIDAPENGRDIERGYKRPAELAADIHTRGLGRQPRDDDRAVRIAGWKREVERSSRLHGTTCAAVTA